MSHFYRYLIVVVSFFILVQTTSAQAPWKIKWAETGGGDLIAVYFTSEKDGWIGGDGGYLASTNDGGKTWSKYPLPSTDDINEIYFRNDDNGYIVAGRKMFITHNAGKNWQETNLIKSGEVKAGTPEFLSIRFADKKRGLAIGSIWKKQGKDEVVVDSLVMRSEDGGATWRRILVPARGELYHLDFSGSSHAWIVGDRGVVLASTDGGRSWKLQTSGVRLPLYNVDFRDDNEGYAVGKSGVILRTENGGARWERVITPFTESLMRVDFADDKKGWIVGYNGTVLRSNDKGRRWIKQDSGATANFYGLFMNKKIGWAVGQNGLLIEYLL